MTYDITINDHYAGMPGTDLGRTYFLSGKAGKTGRSRGELLKTGEKNRGAREAHHEKMRGK